MAFPTSMATDRAAFFSALFGESNIYAAWAPFIPPPTAPSVPRIVPTVALRTMPLIAPSPSAPPTTSTAVPAPDTSVPALVTPAADPADPILPTLQTVVLLLYPYLR